MRHVVLSSGEEDPYSFLNDREKVCVVVFLNKKVSLVLDRELSGNVDYDLHKLISRRVIDLWFDHGLSSPNSEVKMTQSGGSDVLCVRDARSHIHLTLTEDAILEVEHIVRKVSALANSVAVKALMIALYDTGKHKVMIRATVDERLPKNCVFFNVKNEDQLCAFDKFIVDLNKEKLTKTCRSSVYDYFNLHDLYLIQTYFQGGRLIDSRDQIMYLRGNMFVEPFDQTVNYEFLLRQRVCSVWDFFKIGHSSQSFRFGIIEEASSDPDTGLSSTRLVFLEANNNFWLTFSIKQEDEDLLTQVGIMNRLKGVLMSEKVGVDTRVHAVALCLAIYGQSRSAKLKTTIDKSLCDDAFMPNVKGDAYSICDMERVLFV